MGLHFIKMLLRRVVTLDKSVSQQGPPYIILLYIIVHLSQLNFCLFCFLLPAKPIHKKAALTNLSKSKLIQALKLARKELQESKKGSAKVQKFVSEGLGVHDGLSMNDELSMNYELSGDDEYSP